MEMTRTKKTPAILGSAAARTVLAVAVMVVGLAVTADRMAATNAGAPDSGTIVGGADAAKAGPPDAIATAIDADDRPGRIPSRGLGQGRPGLPGRGETHGQARSRQLPPDRVRRGRRSRRSGSAPRLDAVRSRRSPGVGRPLRPAFGDFIEGRQRTRQRSRPLRGVSASGLAVAGPYQVEANSVMGGWDVHWDRSKDGFQVRGDETRVHVWPDGRIQSVAHVEHQLAATPGQRLGDRRREEGW